MLWHTYERIIYYMYTLSHKQSIWRFDRVVSMCLGIMLISIMLMPQEYLVWKKQTKVFWKHSIYNEKCSVLFKKNFFILSSLDVDLGIFKIIGRSHNLSTLDILQLSSKHFSYFPYISHFDTFHTFEDIWILSSIFKRRKKEIIKITDNLFKSTIHQWVPFYEVPT